MEIIIERETYRRIKGFTKLANGEVAGIARVKFLDSKLYVSNLILLPDQETTSSSVEFEPLKLMRVVISQNSPEEFRFMWHSHANMNTFISGTDEACIEYILKTSPFVISCVSNKEGKLLLRLDARVEGGIRISIICDYRVEEFSYDDLKEELKRNVKTKSYYFQNDDEEDKDNFSDVSLFSIRRKITENLYKGKKG